MTIQDLHVQRFVAKVIELLETRPDDFCGKWFTGKTLDSSVQYKDRELLICDTGDIIQPIRPQLTTEQRAHIKQLVQAILDRDSLLILANYNL